ncbi:hypothetical protein CsSME_00045076 [Camellia sinensis var. sinensis]
MSQEERERERENRQCEEVMIVLQKVKEKVQRQMGLAPAHMSKLAAEYSECPSGKKGGDLGWFPRGKMTGPFQDVAFSTPVGATSAPFKSTPAISVMLLMAHVWIPHYLV